VAGTVAEPVISDAEAAMEAALGDGTAPVSDSAVVTTDATAANAPAPALPVGPALSGQNSVAAALQISTRYLFRRQ
jgi:hypothetical protein